MNEGKKSKSLKIELAKGIGKGVVYYIIYYVLLIGFIVYYVIPYIANSTGLKGFDTAGLTGFTPVNISVLAWFIGLYTLLQLSKAYLPYSSLADAAIHITALYIILYSIRFGKIEKYLPKYNAKIILDASPLLLQLFYILIAFNLGGALISVAKEYKKKHQLKPVGEEQGEKQG